MEFQEGNNYMSKKFPGGIDSRASNRFHYCSGTDTLVEVNTIFFDENHKIHSFGTSIGDRFNLVPSEQIFHSPYGSYFKDYILEDLFYLGYIDRKHYLTVKFCVDITESSIFKNSIKCFIENNHNKLSKAEIHTCGEVWTNGMEIAICNLVAKKYYSNEEVEKRNAKKNPGKLMKEYSDKDMTSDVLSKLRKPFIEIRCSYNSVEDMIKDKDSLDSGSIIHIHGSDKFYYKDTDGEFSFLYCSKPENDLIPNDYTISWGSYFMGIAQLVKKRSKDPACKVGACIVRDKKILSTGYNGFPRGIDDDKYPWTKDSNDPTKNKFFYVVHAELNAILNSDTPVTDAELYVTKFPCNECAKAIIQSGIKKIIYNDDKDDPVLFNAEKNKVTLSMLTDAGIEVVRYCPIRYNELIRL